MATPIPNMTSQSNADSSVYSNYTVNAGGDLLPWQQPSTGQSLTKTSNLLVIGVVVVVSVYLIKSAK